MVPCVGLCSVSLPCGACVDLCSVPLPCGTMGWSVLFVSFLWYHVLVCIICLFLVVPCVGLCSVSLPCGACVGLYYLSLSCGTVCWSVLFVSFLWYRVLVCVLCLFLVVRVLVCVLCLFLVIIYVGLCSVSLSCGTVGWSVFCVSSL